MRRTVKMIALGAAALLTAARFLPPTTLTMTTLGLVCMLAMVYRRRRQLTLAPL